MNEQGQASPFPGRALCFLRTQSGQRLDLLPNRVYVLGRGAVCDVQVEDEACSRRHAQLSVAGDGTTVTLQDLSSKNGTFRNEGRVQGCVQLEGGDQIRIGESRFVLLRGPVGPDGPVDTHTQIAGMGDTDW